MKKCWSCGITVDLKRMWRDLCSDEFIEGHEFGSTCKKCYLELGCQNEHGNIEDCIKYSIKECDMSDEYRFNLQNWDKLDYHYKPLKRFEQQISTKVKPK